MTLYGLRLYFIKEPQTARQRPQAKTQAATGNTPRRFSYAFKSPATVNPLDRSTESRRPPCKPSECHRERHARQPARNIKTPKSKPRKRAKNEPQNARHAHAVQIYGNATKRATEPHRERKTSSRKDKRAPAKIRAAQRVIKC